MCIFVMTTWQALREASGTQRGKKGSFNLFVTVPIICMDLCTFILHRDINRDGYNVCACSFYKTTLQNYRIHVWTLASTSAS